MEWKTIKSAPKDGTVIILLRDGEVYAGFYAVDTYAPGVYHWVVLDAKAHDGKLSAEGAVLMNALNESRGPTHWMPLPDPE